MSFYKSLNYFREGFVLKWKSILEFKVNFYMSLLSNISYILIGFLFLWVLYFQFNDVVNWSIVEYLFFFIFFNVITSLSGVFFYGVYLSGYLLGGELNNYLLKPVNVFLQYVVNSSLMFVLPNFVLYLVLFMVLVWKFGSEINMFYLLLALPYILLVMVFYILSYRFFDSFAFFIKQNMFLVRMISTVDNIYQSYPFAFFSSGLKLLGYFFAGFYATSFITMFVFGQITFSFFLKLNLLLVVFDVLLGFGIYLLWHYGLKRYEAFGG